MPTAAPLSRKALFCGSCGAPVQNAVEPMQPAVPVELPVAPVESQPSAPVESAAPAQAPVYPVYQQPVYVQPVSPLKGSNGVGVASFVMSMVSLVATIAVIAIISSIMDSVSSFYFSFSELQTLCTSGIVLAILALLVSIVGLILGIVGVARRNVKKGLALTGLIISGVELLARLRRDRHDRRHHQRALLSAFPFGTYSARLGSGPRGFYLERKNVMDQNLRLLLRKCSAGPEAAARCTTDRRACCCKRAETAFSAAFRMRAPCCAYCGA